MLFHLEAYMSRSGIFVKNLSGALTYLSFKPTALPPTPDIILDDDIQKRLKKAYFVLGQLDKSIDDIPNKTLFISMYVRKEALLSSQMEGTQATLDDIFNPNIDHNLNLDVDDVIRYVKASHYANTLSETLPISTRFIKDIHKVLLSNQRGHDKEPGELRKTQNWIGPQGSSLKTARFIPPNISDMHEALADLEHYIHKDMAIDPLIKIALIHYQFETIHPFLDGNGRIGRLLIHLLLKHYHLISEDMMYMSYYLKKNQQEYYDRMMDVRLKGHYEKWIIFFLDGIIDSTHHALETIDQLKLLKQLHLKQLDTLQGKLKQTALSIYHYLELHPITTIKQASLETHKVYNTVNQTFLLFIELGILKQVNDVSRNKVFAFEPYLIILRDGTS